MLLGVGRCEGVFVIETVNWWQSFSRGLGGQRGPSRMTTPGKAQGCHGESYKIKREGRGETITCFMIFYFLVSSCEQLPLWMSEL